MLASLLGSGGPVTTGRFVFRVARQSTNVHRARYASLLSGLLPNAGGRAHSTTELQAHRSNQRMKQLCAASFGNVPSYDRTEVLLNTFACLSDDDGTDADAFWAPQLVYRRSGFAIDDTRWVIGSAPRRRYYAEGAPPSCTAYEMPTPSVGKPG
jgi:hypothetical protein